MERACFGSPDPTTPDSAIGLVGSAVKAASSVKRWALHKVSDLLLGRSPDGEAEAERREEEWSPSPPRQGGEGSFVARPTEEGTKRARSSSEARCMDGAEGDGQPSVSYLPMSRLDGGQLRAPVGGTTSIPTHARTDRIARVREQGARRDEEERTAKGKIGTMDAMEHQPMSVSRFMSAQGRFGQDGWSAPLSERKAPAASREHHRSILKRKDAGARKSILEVESPIPTSFTFPSPATGSPLRRPRIPAEGKFSPYRRIRAQSGAHAMGRSTPSREGFVSWRQATLERTSNVSPTAGLGTPVSAVVGKRRRETPVSGDAQLHPSARLRLGVGSAATRTPSRLSSGTPTHVRPLPSPHGTLASQQAHFADISTETARKILMTLDSMGKTASATLTPELDVGHPTPVDFSKSFPPPTVERAAKASEQPPPTDMLGTFSRGDKVEEESKFDRRSTGGVSPRQMPDQVHMPSESRKVQHVDSSDAQKEKAAASVDALPDFPVFTFRSPSRDPKLESLAKSGAETEANIPTFTFAGASGAAAEGPAPIQAVSIPFADKVLANARAAAAASSPLPLPEGEDEMEEELPQKGFSKGVALPSSPKVMPGLDFLKKTVEDATAAADATAKASPTSLKPLFGQLETTKVPQVKAPRAESHEVSFQCEEPTSEKKSRGHLEEPIKTEEKDPSLFQNRSQFKFDKAFSQDATVGFAFGGAIPQAAFAAETKTAGSNMASVPTKENKLDSSEMDRPKVTKGWDTDFLKKNASDGNAASVAAREEIEKSSGAALSSEKPSSLFAWAPAKEATGVAATQGTQVAELKSQDSQGLVASTKGFTAGEVTKFPVAGAQVLFGAATASMSKGPESAPTFLFGSAPPGVTFGSTAAIPSSAKETDDSLQPLKEGAPTRVPGLPEKPCIDASSAPLFGGSKSSAMNKTELIPAAANGTANPHKSFVFGAKNELEPAAAAKESSAPIKTGVPALFGSALAGSMPATATQPNFFFGASTSTPSEISTFEPTKVARAEPEDGQIGTEQLESKPADPLQPSAKGGGTGFVFGASTGSFGTSPSLSGGMSAPFSTSSPSLTFLGAGSNASSSTIQTGTSQTLGSGAGTCATNVGPLAKPESSAPLVSIGSGAPAPIFGASKDSHVVPTFGSAASAPVFGSTASAPVFGSAASAPVFGSTASAPVFGSAASAPLFGSATSAPVFGSATSAPVFGSAMSAPVFGASSSAATFGTSASVPSFNGANSTQSAALTPSTFVFGSSSGAGGLGTPTSMAAFAGPGATPFGTSNTALPTAGFGGASSLPSFGTGSATVAFAAGSNPTFGSNASGGPVFGNSNSAPSFMVSNVAPAFGAGTSFPSNNDTSFAAGAGGFSMGAAGQPPSGQRRRIVKARRPARK